MIEPPDDMYLPSESQTSPIVINDKMLSLAGIPSPNANSRGSLSSSVSPSLLTQYDMEIFKQIQNRVNDKKYVGNHGNEFVDSETISYILMDLNYQDYELQGGEMI